MKFNRLLLCLVPIGLLISSCSSNSGAQTTTTTTVKIGDPVTELERLAKQLAAVDYSRISESTCGKFSLVVAPSNIHFFEWTSNGWKQDDVRFGDWTPPDSYLVTTRDYTNDGTNEFLVNFASEAPIGAIFGQIDCKWQWLTFQGQMGPEQRTVDSLTWSDDSTQLTGIDYDEEWNKLDSSFNWDAHYKAFFGEATESPSSQVQVSADCALYMDNISYWELQHNSSKTYYQRSLVVCSRDEWIAYADTHRSPYSTWETYMDSTTPYNTEGTGVILANGSPEGALDYLCKERKSSWKKQADEGGAFSSYARDQYNELKNSACSK